MIKTVILDASASDSRVMSSLLSRAGYDPVIADSMEKAKELITQLPPERLL